MSAEIIIGPWVPKLVAGLIDAGMVLAVETLVLDLRIADCARRINALRERDRWAARLNTDPRWMIGGNR